MLAINHQNLVKVHVSISTTNAGGAVCRKEFWPEAIQMLRQDDICSVLGEDLETANAV